MAKTEDTRKKLQKIVRFGQKKDEREVEIQKLKKEISDRIEADIESAKEAREQNSNAEYQKGAGEKDNEHQQEIHKLRQRLEQLRGVEGYDTFLSSMMAVLNTWEIMVRLGKEDGFRIPVIGATVPALGTVIVNAMKNSDSGVLNSMANPGLVFNYIKTKLGLALKPVTANAPALVYNANFRNGDLDVSLKIGDKIASDEQIKALKIGIIGWLHCLGYEARLSDDNKYEFTKDGVELTPEKFQELRDDKLRGFEAFLKESDLSAKRMLDAAEKAEEEATTAPSPGMGM